MHFHALGSLPGERGTPSYVHGKEATTQPSNFEIKSVCLASQCMGNAWLLTKFATKPVALKNRPKMTLIRRRSISPAIQKRSQCVPCSSKLSLELDIAEGSQPKLISVTKLEVVLISHLLPPSQNNCTSHFFRSQFL
jgi:hypothetical protein